MSRLDWFALVVLAVLAVELAVARWLFYSKLLPMMREAGRARALARGARSARGAQVSWQVPQDAEDVYGKLRGVLHVEGMRRIVVADRHFVAVEDVLTVLEAEAEIGAEVQDAVRFFRGLYGSSLAQDWSSSC